MSLEQVLSKFNELIVCKSERIWYNQEVVENNFVISKDDEKYVIPDAVDNKYIAEDNQAEEGQDEE